MGRLIDADLLKKNIAKWLQGGDPQETEMVKLDDIAVSIVMEIEEQPTAYDVENVVAELENEKERQEKDRSYWSEHSWKDNLVYNEYDLSDKKADLLQEAIDIVKRGGVDGKE